MNTYGIPINNILELDVLDALIRIEQRAVTHAHNTGDKQAVLLHTTHLEALDAQLERAINS